MSSADAARSRPGPDAVLTDWLLPDGTGLEVCRALGRRADPARAGGRGSGVTLGEGRSRRRTVRHGDGAAQARGSRRHPGGHPQPGSSGGMASGAEARVRSGMRRTCAAARANRGIRADAEPLLQRAASRSGDSVTLVIADDPGRYVAASGPTRELTGYDSNELATLSVWDLTPLPNTPEGRGLWKEFIEAGIQQGQYVLRRRDGRPVEARRSCTRQH